MFASMSSEIFPYLSIKRRLTDEKSHPFFTSVTVEASEHGSGGAAKTAVPASSIAKAATRRIIEIFRHQHAPVWAWSGQRSSGVVRSGSFAFASERHVHNADLAWAAESFQQPYGRRFGHLCHEEV